MIPPQLDDSSARQTSEAIGNTVPRKELGEAPSADELGQRTKSGFIWLIAQTVFSKVIGFAGQLALAHVLAPADFGLFAVAYAITLGIGWMQEAGAREILVRRQKHYARWANSAFWLTVLIGIGGYALAFSIAPLMERFYGMPELANMIRVAALSPAFTCISNVAQARLEIVMRFQFLARLAVVLMVMQTVFTIVLAYLGFHAFSFVIPYAVLAFGKCVYLYSVVRPPIRLNLQLRRWRYLVGGFGLLITSGACSFILWQGDYIILGRIVSKNELGLYYFAYQLSQQTLSLLTNNINSVLLPSLSQLQQDKTRQLDVYLRATRSLAVVGALLCLLPALSAGAIIALFFNAKWTNAAPILAVLSLGMVVRVADATSEALLKAQGRLATLTATSIAHALTFVVIGLFAAHYKGALGMACAVGICIALFGPLRVYLGVRPLGGTLRDVAGIFLGVFSIFALAQVVPLALAHFVFPQSHLALLLLTSVLGTIIYIGLLRLFAPALLQDLLSRFKRKQAPA